MFDPAKRRFWSVASPANPWVHDCVPLATANKQHAWLGTRTGLLRLDLTHNFWAQKPHLASVALRLAEVDGATRNPSHLGQLAAGQHRVTFLFRGVSLLRGNTLQYQYRLRVLSDAWSRPSSVGEAQFPGLNAGNYTFEVRTRSNEASAWSKSTEVVFSIATPF